jgi:hypothetical protein
MKHKILLFGDDVLLFSYRECDYVTFIERPHSLLLYVESMNCMLNVFEKTLLWPAAMMRTEFRRYE